MVRRAGAGGWRRVRFGLALIRRPLAIGRNRIALPNQSRKLDQRIGRGAGIARAAAIIVIVAVAARIRVIRH
jgi:hypothetical protein